MNFISTIMVTQLIESGSAQLAIQGCPTLN